MTRPKMKKRIEKRMTVFFVPPFCLAKIMFLVQPTMFMAAPVYAPSRMYWTVKIPSFSVRKMRMDLCFLHWKDMMLATTPSAPISCMKSSMGDSFLTDGILFDMIIADKHKERKRCS